MSGGVDLSVGSVIALPSVVTAVLLRDGASNPTNSFKSLCSLAKGFPVLLDQLR